VIVAICGPPGAGKTTIAERLRDRLTEGGRSVELLHSDQFSRRTYEQLYERALEAADADVVLVDGTFYREAFRDPFRDLGARFLLVTADLETCLRRNRSRENSIDEVGVRVVHGEFAPLDADLTIDADELDPGAAVERIARAIERWECEADAS